MTAVTALRAIDNQSAGPVRPGATETANAVAPVPEHRLDRYVQNAKGTASVYRDWGRMLGSMAWLHPPTVTVPVPPGSTATPAPGESHDFWHRLKVLGESSVTYAKHLLMPTLAPSQEVVGYVAGISKQGSGDGDLNMDIVPLPPYQQVLYYKGKLQPHGGFGYDDNEVWQTQRGHELAQRSGAIHAEVKMDRQRELAPFINDVQRAVLAGQTPLVSVTGRRTFDPFHAGWVEIHPVRAAHVISATGDGFPQPLPIHRDAKLPTETD